MKYAEAMALCQKGYERWAGKEHNIRWVRRIDGTPIPNDLLVNIAVTIALETEPQDTHN